MKLSLAIVLPAGLALLAGCYEPPYSYDVRGNGEGGVNITTVPHRDVPGPPPAPVLPPTIIYVPVPETAPTTQPSQPTVYVPMPPPVALPPPSQPATQPDEQQHIADLEAQVKALAAENAKLKQQMPATVPATMPTTDPQKD